MLIFEAFKCKNQIGFATFAEFKGVFTINLLKWSLAMSYLPPAGAGDVCSMTPGTAPF